MKQWDILIYAIYLTVWFAFLLVYYLLSLDFGTYHLIEVENRNPQAIKVIFGGLSENGTFEYFPPHQLETGAKVSYYATPGCFTSTQAYLATNTNVNPAPFTNVLVQLAGNGFGSPGIITGAGYRFTDMKTNANNQDYYGISLQKGYNLRASVRPDTPDPKAEVRVISEITQQQCPTVSGNGTYQWCATPCFVNPASTSCCVTPGSCEANNCQQSWIDAYGVFYNSCPQCLITNCDSLQYHYSSEKLSSYKIAFL